MNRNVVIVVATMMVCITILLVAFYVWPTPYRYEKHGPNGMLLSKTDRCTGEVEVIGIYQIYTSNREKQAKNR